MKIEQSYKSETCTEAEMNTHYPKVNLQTSVEILLLNFFYLMSCLIKINE